MKKYTPEEQQKAFEKITQSYRDIEARFPDNPWRQQREMQRLVHVRQANFRRPALRDMQEAMEKGDTKAAIDAAHTVCGICDVNAA